MALSVAAFGRVVSASDSSRTRNPVVPGSSPTLATCSIALGRPEYKSSATLD